MKSSKNKLVIPNNQDPFNHMIMRPHKSPQLKPVIIDSRKCIKISRSAGSIREKIVLPPITSRAKANHPAFDRISIKTPDFRVSAGKLPRKCIEQSNKNYFPINDISFGDIDENIGGLNNIMNKYHFE